MALRLQKSAALLCALLAICAVSLAGAAWWVHSPLQMADPQAKTEVAIAPGSSSRAVAQAVVQAGVQTSPVLLYAWFRASGQAHLLRSGHYALPAGTTPRTLLAMLVRGDQQLLGLTLVEGWHWRQVRQALAKAPHLRPDSQALSDAQLMARLGRPGVSPEGVFFPDSYRYAKHTSDVQVLAQAMAAMDRHLARAWASRAEQLPLRTPHEALVLASIIEKETGQASDRAMIGSVFHNRLRQGMRLQTDPTVIYGLGAAFDGNLRRVHLQTDTPWNTYTRAGLPPTPIAMPGLAALQAAVRPASSDALYFVARGDGSSQFSPTLAEHNRAVQRYQIAPAAAKRAALPVR